MAAITTVREYCALLAKSKLLPGEEIELLHRQWKDEARGQDDQLDLFCKFLVSRRTLTEWQAAMVRRGRADGFFIAGYKILDRIGKGQMGGVYKAVHGLGQVVALKILPASKAKDQHVLGRFQREARLLTQLDHPNVVRAFQVGEGGGVHYIAMEFLEGETLDEVLNRRKKLPWMEAVRLIHQALNGLEHLYERRMIHRDVKPANMMLTPAPGKHEATWEATLKILDIGLGRELFDDDAPEGKIDTQLTVEGSVLGTPDFLAPEQAKDARTADIRADIYSVGCVLFHCVCGRPVFPDTNIMSQMLKHATEKPPLLSSFAPDVPPGLQSVVDVLLAKFPDDRYATPAAAAEALKPFLPTSGAVPTSSMILPSYKQWLESESHPEMPKIKQPAPVAPNKPSPLGNPAVPAKPGTAPAPALAAAQARETMPRTGNSKPVPYQAARPVPVAPARPPGSPRRAPVDEVDVELVPDPLPAPFLIPTPVEPQVMEEDRSLLEFDRRDWIMLAAGAASVLSAVGVGYGLSRLLRKNTEDVTDGE